jgi:D-arabinose 5-phosphate isomerase GutQ
VSPQEWDVKESSLIKAISAKRRSKFAALSQVMVTVTGQLKNCSGGYKQINKTIHTPIFTKD